MYPNIVRQLDIALVKLTIGLYNKKYENISEHDWLLIVQYNVFVEELTKHLTTELDELEKLITLKELIPDIINKSINILYDKFRKNFHLYLKTRERDQRPLGKEYFNIENSLKNIQWSTVFSLEIRQNHVKELSFLFWLNLFSNINDKENIHKEVDIAISKFLAECIANIFKHHPNEKEKLLKELNDTNNYDQIINSIIKRRPSYGFLSIYTNTIKLVNDKHLSSTTLLGALLSEQARYWHNLEKNENYNKFYFDAIRGTELDGKNIDLIPLQDNAQALLINDVINHLKSKNVSKNLIEYVLNYVHQNGITQTGSNLFQLETNKRSASFSDFKKNVRIELISPTQIRILSPVIYNSYFIFSEHAASEAPIKKRNPIYFELTSLVLEDNNPQSKETSPSFVNVTIEDCFNELVEPDIFEYWSHINIEFILQKLIQNIELESQERRLMSPYLTHTQRLQNLEDAPPAILIMLMLKDYNHAIEIVKNETLINKVFDSEYNNYINKVYYKFKNVEKFIQASSQEGFWFSYQQMKPLIFTLIDISEQLHDPNTDSNTKTFLNNNFNKIIINIRKMNNNNMIFDIIRTCNTTDILKLIKNISIVNLLSTEQILLLIKKNADIALVLLSPQSSDIQLLDQHPASKLTQNQLFEIINHYPELWTTPNSGFDLKATIPAIKKSQDKSVSPTISYRSKLSADTLVLCVFNDNDKSRKHAVTAIANDAYLIKKLFSSKKLVEDLSKLVRFYFESSDSIKSQIKLIPEFRAFMLSNQDFHIKEQLTRDVIEHSSESDLLNMLVKELLSNNPNQNYIEIYTDCIHNYLENELTKKAMSSQLEILWKNTISQNEKNAVHRYLNKRFSIILMQSPSVKTLLNTDAVLLDFLEDVIPPDNIMTYVFLLNLLKDLIDSFLKLDNTNQILFLSQNKNINLLLHNLLNNDHTDTSLINLSDSESLNLYKVLNLYGSRLDTLLSYVARVNNSEQKDIIIENIKMLVQTLTPKFTNLIFNHYINKYYKNNLEDKDYKLLFQYYVINPLFRQKLNLQALILQKLIENSGPAELTKLLSLDRSMTSKIITILTTNQQVRDALFSNNPPNKYSEEETKQFITTLLKSILQSQGVKGIENFVQLILISQTNSQFDIKSIVSADPFLKSQLTSSINQLENKQSLSTAKQFLSMPAVDRNIFLKDKVQVANVINNANREELNLIFSLHENLLKEWQSYIMKPDNKFSRAICESIIYQITDMTDLTNIYLFTTKENHDFILKDNLLLNRMLSYTINLPTLYTKDSFIRQHIENDVNLINAMLSNKSKPDAIFNVYMIANITVREMILSNNLALNTLILMNNTSNLSKLIDVEPKLSSKLISTLAEYYLKTEYMKWFTNRDPQLLNKLLNSFNADQFIVLLTSNPKKAVIDTLVNNEHCYSLLLKLNQNQISSINNYRKIISQFYDNFPNTPLPTHIRQMLLENLKIPLEKTQASTTHQYPSLDTSVDKDSIKFPSNISQGIKK